LRLFFITACLLAASSAAQAQIGSTARRGDNCTPFKAYAVGFPVGASNGASPITNEAVILADGWKAVGWILTARDGTLRLVAYRPTPQDDEESPGQRGYVALRSESVSDIRKTYAAYRAATIHAGIGKPSDFVAALNQFTVSPCFSAGLPKGS
jgi:hypothetical protein